MDVNCVPPMPDLLTKKYSVNNVTERRGLGMMK